VIKIVMPETMAAILNSQKCHDLLVYFNRPNSLIALKYTELFNMYNWSYTLPKRFLQSLTSTDCFYITIPGLTKTIFLFKKKDQTRSITRMEMPPIQAGEIWYLRLILLNKPVISYDEAINSCDTFQLAAISEGYVNDKQEALLCFQMATAYSTPPQLRALFVLLTIQGFPTHIILEDDDLMAKMNEDFYFKNNLNKRLAFNDFLNDLTFRLESEGRNLNEYGLPSPESITTELEREKCKYDKSEQLNLLRRLEHEKPNNVEQQLIFDYIKHKIHQNHDELINIQGKGGSGKSTLAKKILAWARSEGHICLGCASTALAATVYDDFTTAHDLFCFPVIEEEDKETNEPIKCNIHLKPQRKELINHTKVIIWDEFFSNNRDLFEAAYEATDCFKGIVLICLNDCRQIGPVVQKGNRYDIVNASIISSHLWSKFTKFKLEINMRLTGSNSHEMDEFTLKQKKYAELILDIGNGKNDSICYDCLEEDENLGVQLINIPDIKYFLDSDHAKASAIELIYPNEISQSLLHRRAILAGNALIF
jgi:PIF1-like helicase